MAKTKKNYILDVNGNKIYDPVKRQYKCGRCIQINDWNDRGNVEKWRREWAIACNREYERSGLKMRVTHMSYLRQGLDREPTKYLGRKVVALEARGIMTERGDENRRIIERNKVKKRERQRERQHEKERGRAYERSR